MVIKIANGAKNYADIQESTTIEKYIAKKVKVDKKRVSLSYKSFLRSVVMAYRQVRLTCTKAGKMDALYSFESNQYILQVV